MYSNQLSVVQSARFASTYDFEINESLTQGPMTVHDIANPENLMLLDAGPYMKRT